MKAAFPPLVLRAPRIEIRKPQSRPIPLPPEVVRRRQLIAQQLQEKVSPVSKHLRQLSPEERKAVFVKLEHDRPIPLGGTALKAVSEPGEHVTLAILREDDLSKLESKISIFGVGELKKTQPPNQFVAALKNVELGNPTDRLSDEMLDRYKTDVKKNHVVYEIEMVALVSGSKQRRAELARIRQELKEFLGTHGTIFEHEERGASCHAVVRTTGEQLRQLVEEPRWQIKVIGFDARPQFETYSEIFRDFNLEKTAIGQIDPNSPIVCVIDSGVSPGNPFLAPVTRDDLVKSFLGGRASNPYDENGHGSGVASLVAYYALGLAAGAKNEPHAIVASARVLDANNQGAEHRLFSLALREVVKTFAPLGVKIFNLSVNNIQYRWSTETRRTVPRRSWIARTIDHLSREYDVVFVVSTGNFDLATIQDFMNSGAQFPAYLLREEAKLWDPAQAALALTVGSIAATPRVIGNSGTTTAMAALNHPSPFTRSGPGVAREIKPELVEYGGNFVFDTDDQRVKQNLGTDLPLATHKLSPAITHNAGTSYAAARVSHKLSRLQQDLIELTGHVPGAPLLKAFIVSSARRRDNGHDYQDAAWLNSLGYGMPDHVRATDANDYSVAMFYEGVLPVNSVAYFDIPVPATLVAAKGPFRLTITVVHAPEVQRHGLETYLGTTLKWRMFRGDTPQDKIVNAMSVDETGASLGAPVGENEKIDDLKFTFGVNQRSRGTVQHDSLEWSRHQDAHSEHVYTLAIAAYEKWHRLHPPDVPFAVVVRLEDVGESVKIYTEVRNLLSVEVQT